MLCGYSTQISNMIDFPDTYKHIRDINNLSEYFDDNQLWTAKNESNLVEIQKQVANGKSDLTLKLQELVNLKIKKLAEAQKIHDALNADGIDLYFAQNIELKIKYKPSIIEINNKKYFFKPISELYFLYMFSSAITFLKTYLNNQKGSKNINKALNVYPYLVLFKTGKYLNCGYIMDCDNEESIISIKQNDKLYFDYNKQLMQTKAQQLVDELIELSINDTEFSDNIYWNKSKKSIAYLGPSSHAFYDGMSYTKEQNKINYDYRIKELFDLKNNLFISNKNIY